MVGFYQATRLVQSAVVRRVNRVGSRPARSLSPSSRKLPERDTGFDERKTGLSPFLGSKGHVSHCSAQRCCGVGADRHDRAETGRTCRRWSRENSGKRLTGTFLLVIVVQQLARAGSETSRRKRASCRARGKAMSVSPAVVRYHGRGHVRGYDLYPDPGTYAIVHSHVPGLVCTDTAIKTGPNGRCPAPHKGFRNTEQTDRWFRDNPIVLE